MRRLPAWAWVALAVLAVTVLAGWKLVPRGRRSAESVAGEDAVGLSRDVAAALSGQPSTNAAPIDQLAVETQEALGVGLHQFDTIAGAKLKAANSVVFTMGR